MGKKKTYASVMDSMSKKLQTYQNKLQDAQNRGDSVGIQDYGRRIQRVQAGMESLFQEQEASKQPQMSMGGTLRQYGPGGLTQQGYLDYKYLYGLNNMERTPEEARRFKELQAQVDAAKQMGWQEDFGFNPDGSIAGRPIEAAEIATTTPTPSSNTTAIETNRPKEFTDPYTQKTYPVTDDMWADMQNGSFAQNMRLGNYGEPNTATSTGEEVNLDSRPGYETGYDPTAPFDGGFTQGNRKYYPDPLAGLGTIPAPGFIESQSNDSDQSTSGSLNLDTSIDQQSGTEVTNPTANTDLGSSTIDPVGGVTPEQRAQYEAAEAQVDAQRAAANATQTNTGNATTGNDALGNFFNSLQGKQNPLKQYGQFLPDIAAAIQMERSQGPTDLPMPTMARQNTNVNYNPIMARAQQDLANRNAMLSANIADPQLRAAMMQDAANQVQSQFGDTTARELDREQALENRYAQDIAQFRTQQGMIGAQNKQRQIDFENDKRATRAKMLQQAGAKYGQIQQENALRELQGKQLGISALAYEGDMIQRMAERYPALEALITGR